jgi:hypothetical protein
MSKAFDKLIERAQDLGIEFIGGVPTRAHHKLQGQLWDTFACYEYGGYRNGEICSTISYTYRGKKYSELTFKDSVKILAKAKELEIRDDDDFSDRLNIGEPRPKQTVELYETSLEDEDWGDD